MQKKFQEKFFVSEITSYELVALNCLFSSEVNVLKTVLKILLITKRDFSRLTCYRSYQKIW